METEKNLIELSIPSKFGFEKIAVDCAVVIAHKLEFLPSQVDDLKTAVTEACLNAIEHGNRMDTNINVIIRISSSKEAIIIEVEDYGTGTFEESYEKPDLVKKINGNDHSRGWGLFLIKNLMDKVELMPIPDKGKRLEMTLYRKGSPDINARGKTKNDQS